MQALWGYKFILELERHVKLEGMAVAKLQFPLREIWLHEVKFINENNRKWLHFVHKFYEWVLES